MTRKKIASLIHITVFISIIPRRWGWFLGGGGGGRGYQGITLRYQIRGMGVGWGVWGWDGINWGIGTCLRI